MLAKMTTADKIPHKIGNKDFRNFVKLYSILYWDSLHENYQMVNEPKFRKLVNTALDGFSLHQLVAMVFCHFEWYGPSGKQESDYSWVAEKKFPIEILVSNRYRYSAYILGVLGQAIWSDDTKLANVIEIWVDRLMSKKV